MDLRCERKRLEEEAHANQNETKFAEAAVYLERAVALEPPNVKYVLNLGVALENLKRFAEAEALYLRTLRLMPGHPLLHNNLGVIYLLQGRPEEARSQFEQALKIDPTLPVARGNMERIMTGDGHSTGAGEPPGSDAPKPERSGGAS